jgi:hypothetical protein
MQIALLEEMMREQQYGGDSLAPSTNVTIVRSGVLLATVPWAHHGVLQTMVAHPNHYGAPRFDFVVVAGADEAKQWVAQLQVLFTSQGTDYALVRWMEEEGVNPDDQLRAAGCRRYKWAAKGRGSPAWFQVIEVESILRRVNMVPDFSVPRAGGAKDFPFLYENIFKWDRGQPDNSGFET